MGGEGERGKKYQFSPKAPFDPNQTTTKQAHQVIRPLALFDPLASHKYPQSMQ
jgi:hypothetical protein